MNLWFRLLWFLVLRRVPRADSLLDEARLSFTVWPTDLDLLRHVNNGRYLTLMDLGRVVLLRDSGLWSRLRRLDAIALVGGIRVEYLRPLALFQRFELVTRVVSWDDKWVYLEQRFVRGDTLHARAVVRGLLRGPEGNIPTRTVLALMNLDHRQPPRAVPSGFD